MEAIVWPLLVSSSTLDPIGGATALGLGGCWVAGDKKRYADEVRRLLGVPEGFHLVSFLPVGYPADQTTPKQKRALDSVLHWERF